MCFEREILNLAIDQSVKFALTGRDYTKTSHTHQRIKFKKYHCFNTMVDHSRNAKVMVSRKILWPVTPVTVALLGSAQTKN
jgi:capsid portal protein